MKKINELLFFAESDEEFESHMQKYIDDYIDIMTYLKYVETNNSVKLFQLISSKLEFLDSKNVILNFEELKKRLGLNSKFVIELNESNENNLSSVEVDEKAATLQKSQIEPVCQELHNELLSSITSLYGEIKL